MHTQECLISEKLQSLLSVLSWKIVSLNFKLVFGLKTSPRISNLTKSQNIQKKFSTYTIYENVQSWQNNGSCGDESV